MVTTIWDEAMTAALDAGAEASSWGDVPVGAVVLDPLGAVVAVAGNERERRSDPTAHAEILALRGAAEAADSWRLDGRTLVVTLEPCTMCAGALVLARVGTLVFGAYDPKAGAVASLFDVVRDPRLNHRVDVRGGIREVECGGLLRGLLRRAPRRQLSSSRPEMLRRAPPAIMPSLTHDGER